MGCGNRAKGRCASRPHPTRRTRKGQEGRKPAVPSTRWRRVGTRESLHAQGLFAEVKAIADTGFLVAFGNRRDRYHAWALELANRITDPLLTCEPVLAETVFH